MINAQEVWNKLNAQGMLDEEGKDWNVGNTVMNFARDMENVGLGDKTRVLKLIKDLYGDGSSDITNESNKWTEITSGLWQSVVDPVMFSTDGGATYYSCNDPERVIHKSIQTAVPEKEAETVLA